jgi:hypothetical protein
MAPRREGAINGFSQWIVLGHCTAPFAADIVKSPFFVGKDIGIFRVGFEIPLQNLGWIDDYNCPTFS